MKHLYNLLIFITVFPIFAQEEKPITTAFPFLLLSTDATASGMGDIGVCSSPDVFSQRWNAAKYVFDEATLGVGVGYAPYLTLVRYSKMLIYNYISITIRVNLAEPAANPCKL